MVPVVALLVGFLGLSASADDTAKPAPDNGKTFHASFIGEGGSYQDPNQETKDYYEHNAPLTPAPSGGIKHQDPKPLEPAMPEQRPRDAFIPRDPAAVRHEQISEPPVPAPETAQLAPRPVEDRKRYSLWENNTAPLALPSGKIKDSSDDQVNQMGRRAYDGDRSGPGAVAISGPSKPVGLALSGITPSTAQGETFVTVDFALKGAQLKDAVAGLSGVAGFRQDMRFAPVFSGPGEVKASVSGWLPLSRVGEALRAPLVSRVQTQEGVSLASLPAPGLPIDGPVSQVLVGIRVKAGASVDETFARVTRELGAESGFKLSETVGYQQVPGSKDLALVIVGSVPSRELSALMAHPDVLKVLPAPGAAPVKPAQSRAISEAGKFLSFVQHRAPFLLVITLLLLMAPVADKLGRLLQVFVPYR
jgi:hypothetical protein